MAQIVFLEIGKILNGTVWVSGVFRLYLNIWQQLADFK
jgi:hypothetical protein